MQTLDAITTFKNYTLNELSFLKNKISSVETNLNQLISSQSKSEILIYLGATLSISVSNPENSIRHQQPTKDLIWSTVLEPLLS